MISKVVLRTKKVDYFWNLAMNSTLLLKKVQSIEDLIIEREREKSPKIQLSYTGRQFLILQRSGKKTNPNTN